MKNNETLHDIYGDEPTILSEEKMTGLIKRCNAALYKPLSELTVEDISMLIRQKFYLPTVVPIGLAMLERKPEAEGDMWEGELMQAFADGGDKVLTPSVRERLIALLPKFESDEVLNRFIMEYGTEDGPFEYRNNYVPSLEDLKKALLRAA